MTTFITGTTGYIGSYVAANLLRDTNERLALLVRAKSLAEAERRLWQPFQLHFGFDEFVELVRSRVDLYLGDLTDPDLGLAADTWRSLARSMDSVIHVAASLNRKSAKACINVNLRGTLTVLRLAQLANADHGLRRFSDVSTVAVAGHRRNELVTEENIIDWDRSDYDPYARTKKFCEHMLHELMPDVDHIVFRPSTVLGDSRFPQTIQFDMVRAFVILAQMPVLPLDASWRMDIVPVNYVASAISRIHTMERPRYNAYNLSSGAASEDYRTIVSAMVRAGVSRMPVFAPRIERPFGWLVESASNGSRKSPLTLPASLFKVFLPYLTNNTVFGNDRVVSELGTSPVPFSTYAAGLFQFAKKGGYTYPYAPWPEGASERTGVR
jgi:thioester reductase-like protein